MPKKLLWLVPAVLLLAGCGQSPAVSVQSEDGGYKVEQNGATQTAGTKAELPAGFPKDVPIYPAAQVIFSQSVAGTFTVSWGVADEPAKVTAFYQQELPRQGWPIASSLPEGDKMMLYAMKGGRSVTVAIEPGLAGSGFKTTIGMNVL